jgi:predicted transcriptional regulator
MLLFWIFINIDVSYNKFGVIKKEIFIYMVTYIVVMATTISISQELLSKLKERKMYDKESYEEVIWDALEDSMELSEETKKRIKLAEEDVKAGRVYSLEDVKKELGI